MRYCFTILHEKFAHPYQGQLTEPFQNIILGIIRNELPYYVKFRSIAATARPLSIFGTYTTIDIKFTFSEGHQPITKRVDYNGPLIHEHINLNEIL